MRRTAVAERAGRIDHDLGACVQRLPRLGIVRLNSVDETVSPFRQAGDRRVVQQNRSLVCRGLRQIDQQATVVELTVVIDNAAAQSFGFDGGQAGECFFARQELRRAKAILARQHVIHLQP